MEKRAKYAKIHPEMSNLDLTKILSKKYKELPDKKKVCTLVQDPGSRIQDSRSRIIDHCVFLFLHRLVSLQQNYVTEFQQEKEEFEKNMNRFK